MVKQILSEEFRRMQKLAGIKIDEIKVNKPGFLPIVQPRTDEEVEGNYEIIYDNLINNIKRFKNRIAKHLNITDKDLLNKFLTYYVNSCADVEDQGEEQDYKDITLEEFLEDIAVAYKYSKPADLEPNPNYDTFTIQDIQEIKVNKPGPLQIPEGWTEFEQIFNDEEKIDFGGEFVKGFTAPAEGWDPNNLDTIYIIKTPNYEYIVNLYIPFYDEISSTFNSYSLAEAEALRIMNEIENNWDEEEEEI